MRIDPQLRNKKGKFSRKKLHVIMFPFRLSVFLSAYFNMSVSPLATRRRLLRFPRLSNTTINTEMMQYRHEQHSVAIFFFAHRPQAQLENTGGPTFLGANDH